MRRLREQVTKLRAWLRRWLGGARFHAALERNQRAAAALDETVREVLQK